MAKVQAVEISTTALKVPTRCLDLNPTGCVEGPAFICDIESMTSIVHRIQGSFLALQEGSIYLQVMAEEFQRKLPKVSRQSTARPQATGNGARL
jgi:hypothetical protein